MVGARLEIGVREGRVTATVSRRGRTLWAGQTAWEAPADLQDALAALAAERPRGIRTAVVFLGPELGRVKDVAGLPKLHRRDLALHVRLNSRRYFLQNGVPLVTDARPRRDATRLAGAPVPLVTAICEGLAAAGLRCTDIVPEEARELSLLPEGARARRHHDEVRALVRWWITAAIAVVLAMTAWTLSVVRAGAVARAELAVLQPAYSQALAVRRDLDATTSALETLAAASGSDRAVTVLVARVAAALPDTAFLGSLLVEPNGDVRIAGHAAHASAVLAALDAARLFRTTRFDGSVTRETVAGRDWERFTILGRVAGPREGPGR